MNINVNLIILSFKMFLIFVMSVICFVISNAVLLHNNVSYSHPFNVTNLKIVWINSLSGKSGLHSHQTLTRNLCGEIINMIFTSNMCFAVSETTMVLHFKPNVLTVYNDNNKNVIINYHKSLSCNNFPTVPSKPYISIITTLSICMYIMSCVVLSIIKAISVFYMYGLDLSQTSTGPDRLPRSAVFQHMACSFFAVVTCVDQVVGLLPLGQCLRLLTPRISMSFQICYRDVNMSCL